MKNYQSRLSKRLQRQVMKNLFLSLLGIVIIVVVLINFGIPLLVNLSLFVSDSRNNQEAQVNNKASFVPIPILITQDQATNSAQIQIEGSTLPDQTIVLYVNGSLADKLPTSKSGDFSSIITLNPNKNIIKARTITSDGEESDLSKSLIIVFKNSSPALEISSPSDNQSFAKDQNSVEVRGETDPQVRITVNNFWAIIDENNNFSYILALKDGENEIKIVAQDQAGNKTEKTIKVRYNP